MEEIQQGLEAEEVKEDGCRSNVATDDGRNCESDDQKARAGIWRVKGPARRSSRGNWTEEEDNILQAAVERFKGKCWKKIAECVPNRTDVQCLHRWQKVINPDLVKGPWTKEEDDLIVELVGKQGCTKWSELAKHLPGRIGKQCRERWHNHLNPQINKNSWTREEELILVEAHSKYGNKWAEIAKLLHGRSENSIKNHWNCSLKKKLEQNLYRSGFRLQESATPIIFRVDAEPGNGKEIGLIQSPGGAFCKNQNWDVITDSCSEGRDSHLLPASQRVNSKFAIAQASNSTELSSPAASTGFKQNHDKDTSPGDLHHGIQKLSSVFTSKQLEHGTPFSKDWSNFSFIRVPISSPSSTLGIEGSNEQRTTKRIPKDLAAGNSYTGLCYEPLQAKDLKIVLDEAKFSEKYKLYASSSPESILRRAAMTFQNKPSIIRKPRILPKQDDSDEGKQQIDSNIHTPVQDFASPEQAQGEIVNSSAIIKSMGKSLKDAFNIVWDPRN